MIRVVIADDDPMVRTGLRLILGKPDLDLPGEAGDGRQAMKVIRELGRTRC
ncbi:hypothetical protein [Nonomuraea pusilla]|uniref:Response regulatory domain-containing protein n=1 Tax=Nonomuraea pusilla TaxID=46177 RepID=A0A1H7FZP1_9ACTN|nr:hypothetical protein SAMN05660976_00203 [Nonomuraea pusilla]